MEKYRNAFVNGLEIGEDQIIDELEYQGVPEWDSVGHMSLVSALEEAFDIMMDVDDILEFSSYKKGIDILKSNYSIDFTQ